MPQPSLAPELSGFIHNLRAALPYLEEFHQQIFVVQISGELPDIRTSRVIEDLVLLHQTGVRFVLVHGAEAQIRKLFAAEGHDFRTEEGVFVAEEKQRPLIEQAVASVNWQLLHLLRKCGRRLQVFSGHFLFAERKSFSGNFGPHFNGNVCGVEAETLRQAITDSKLVIIPPFSLGEKGRLWLLDPNQVAFEVATRLRAKKLIVLDSAPLPEFETSGDLKMGGMTTDGIRLQLKKQPGLPPSQILQLQTLTEACERGVERCHLLDATVDGALPAELLTPKGVGVMITNSPYKRTRPARLSDLQAILEILSRPVQQAAVVLRTPAYIEQQIENYLVFCVDEDVVGCCEIIYYLDDSTAEIAGLAVEQSYRNQGLGRALIHAALEQIRASGCQAAYALSTATAHVFEQCGFRQISPEQLPEAKRKNYDFQKSQVFRKSLK